jgi:D-cysteine desulfhydrase
MAGLVTSLGPDAVLGVHVGAVSDPRAAVAAFTDADAARLRIRADQVGEGYGTLTDPVRSALKLAARTEGLILDPTYTGRGLAGLVAAAEAGEIKPGERTVFLHSGGLPGFFGHPQAPGFAESAADATG